MSERATAVQYLASGMLKEITDLLNSPERATLTSEDCVWLQTLMNDIVRLESLMIRRKQEIELWQS